jgi:hypothetical protein
MMSLFHAYENVVNDGHASVSEVLACFRRERNALLQFAFLITGDNAAAEQSVENACAMTVKGHAPFREWLSQWARVATITTAISRCITGIRDCEAMHKDQRCTHAKHLSQTDDAELEHRFNALAVTVAQGFSVAQGLRVAQGFSPAIVMPNTGALVY